MDKNDRAPISASWRRLLFGAVACSALALAVGFVSATETVGLGQPGLLLLAVPAGVFGFRARRALHGALAAPLLGLAGGAGAMWRLSPSGQDWLILTAILGSLGGLVCVVAGSLGGLVGEKSSQAATSRSTAGQDS